MVLGMVLGGSTMVGVPAAAGVPMIVVVLEAVGVWAMVGAPAGVGLQMMVGVPIRETSSVWGIRLLMIIMTVPTKVATGVATAPPCFFMKPKSLFGKNGTVPLATVSAVKMIFSPF